MSSIVVLKSSQLAILIGKHLTSRLSRIAGTAPQPLNSALNLQAGVHMSNELKDHINEHMPYIDQILAEQNIPIHKRFFIAGKLFVEAAIVDSSFQSNEELLGSEVYLECMLPLFNDWYHEKYGDLAKGIGKEVYSGIALAYGQPVKLNIPATTNEVIEEGKLAKMTFPHHLQESETLEKLIQPKFELSKMEECSVKALRSQIEKVVALTRSINLDLNMASNINQPASDMAQGIWSHFEKGISDILSFKSELASIACWEFHLAIEKSIKVLIHSKSGNSKHGHNLDDLIVSLSKYEDGVDSSFLSGLPSDKDAIKLRYAEMKKTPIDAFNYYLIALEFVGDMVSRLEHKIGIKNGSITLKMAPWAR
ncbi:MAG: HEPN domain-containing protein [Desulfobacterium sp.]|nr:HEPN domain-containing protein [Desulfobacterium sp.]